MGNEYYNNNELLTLTPGIASLNKKNKQSVSGKSGFVLGALNEDQLFIDSHNNIDDSPIKFKTLKSMDLHFD